MQSSEPPPVKRSSVHARSWQIAGWIALSLPVLAYAFIAIRTSVNIPFEDDYDGVGDFLEHYVSLHSVWQRIWYVLTAQHVQYKDMVMQAVIAVQYEIIGHLNYAWLSLCGDLSLPATLLLLWIIFARSGRPLLERLWLFAIPSCVFMSLRYAETINWSQAVLQGPVVITFALATFICATASKRSTFRWSLVFLALTIASSVNGFFAEPVVFFLLANQRRFRDALYTVGLTLALGGLYAYHYRFYNIYPAVSHSAALKILAAFPFAFLGNAANSPAQDIILGLILIAGFVFLTRRGWLHVCPASFGGALFCIVTAVVVASGRYKVGINGAFAGHYVMYSVLLISLEYIAMVRLLVPQPLTLRSRWTRSLICGGLASIAFCIWADVEGYRFLHARQRYLITHLILWQRHPERLVLVPDEYVHVQQAEWLPLRVQFQRDMQRHIAEGLYHPPYSASDPLPIRPHSPATLGIEDESPPAN
jgi:hypothetical protein